MSIWRKKQFPLIAAHRGTAGGNIPCNTRMAFEAALHQGADIIELDVSRSKDGKLYVFHPYLEPVQLYSANYLFQLDSKEVEQLRYVNWDRGPTQCPILRFEDAMELLKGRCMINVDKFCDHMAEITAVIRQMNMQDQVIVKTPSGKEWFDNVEAIAPDLPYMAVTHRDDFSFTLTKRHLRYIGTEVLFEKDTDNLCSPEYIAQMHKMDLSVWVNAIVYDYRTVLSGGHNDDISITGHENEGWGWLIDRNFDIIQTDWLMALKSYCRAR